MMQVIVGILGTALVGAITWIILLGNRVSVLEANEQSLRELINSKLADISRRLGDIELVLRQRS